MKPNPLHDIGVFLLRLGLGCAVLFYGSQKLLGLFGGQGFSETLNFFHDKMGIPTTLVALSIFAESFGALAVIFGLLTRLAAVGLLVNFAVATYFSTAKGAALTVIFTHPGPTDPPKLFYPMALGVMSLAVALIGPGRISIDAALFKGKKRSKPAA